MPDIMELERKAVKLALNHDWEKSLEVNRKILEMDSDNIPALNRLGRALIESGKPNEAKKCLNNVLNLDPLNKIAKKNLELAKKLKKGHKHIEHEEDEENADRRGASFIEEPGTTTYSSVKISGKKFSVDSFHPGDNFEVRLRGTRTSLYHENDFVGYLTYLDNQEGVAKLLKSKERITASFQKGEGDRMDIIIKTQTPIFKTEKQDISPYTFHRDERPALEIPIGEE